MYMFKYVMKRLGLMLMSFAIIMTMSFVLIKMLPIVVIKSQGQDANLLYFQLRDRGYIQNLRYDAYGNVNGFDPVPVMIQFYYYLRRVFVFADFGVGVSMPSYQNRPVWDVFISKLPPTMLINIYSTVIGVPIGLGLGILAALKKNKWQDQVINIIIIALISIPGIVFALLIQHYICYKWSILPITMLRGKDYFSWAMFKSMLPAVFSLMLGSIADYARYTRAELSEVLTSEFMLLARTKGLTRGQATLRHAMRNSMVVIFPSILGEFIGILSGSLIIENVFSIPGVGGLYLDAINAKDYDFYMLLSGFYTLIGLTAGIVIDISYGFIDPRIKMGAK